MEIRSPRPSVDCCEFSKLYTLLYHIIYFILKVIDGIHIYFENMLIQIESDGRNESDLSELSTTREHQTDCDDTDAMFDDDDDRRSRFNRQNGNENGQR